MNATALRPHRGVLVLVLGILGLVCSCFPLGIVAWVLGRQDLRDMDAGTMDPAGRGLTQAGKVLGIVNVALSALALLFYAFVLIGVVAMPAFLETSGG